MSYNNDAKNSQKNLVVKFTVEERVELYTDILGKFNLKSTDDLKADVQTFIDHINRFIENNAVVPEEFYREDLTLFLKAIYVVSHNFTVDELLEMRLSPKDLAVHLMKMAGAEDETFPFKEMHKEEEEEADIQFLHASSIEEVMEMIETIKKEHPDADIRVVMKKA